ncbi:MAG: amidase [Geminicoccaceae bacterium]|nr:amidase [Geminicoccaceae bacterium]
MSGHELVDLSAREVVRMLASGEISPVEAIEASLARIEEVDPVVNAVPTVCAERALDRARRVMMDHPPAPADGRGWLAGLPVLIKDLVDVEGVRTTQGSLIFRDHVPTSSAIEVQRIERQGGIVLGKTNTPEFGAGANTFNEVFGATLNPWNTALNCGGSSGGAAVALATGMAWLADGSDLAGSLRTPAGYNGVVGLRPSPGRVAHGPSPSPFQTLSVEGPMARDVRDVAFFLDVMAGFDPRDPLSYDPPVESFSKAVQRPRRPGKVAFSADLGGVTPVDPGIARVCGEAVRKLSAEGTVVIESRAPDLSKSRDVFEILRAELYAANKAPLLEEHGHLLKPEVAWNIRRGLDATAGEIGWAERERGLMQRRMAAFFDDHDLLICPTAIVPPLPVEVRYVEMLGEHRFPTYIDWLAICYAITLTGCPALSIPCGFTADGLPVGLQLIGPPRGEARLLQCAAMIEDLFGLADRLPIDPRRPAPGRKTPRGES